MREDIKKRIELIKEGRVPSGYFRHKCEIVPKEFSIVTLDKLVDFQNGINAEREKFGQGVKIISVSDILQEEPIYYNTIKGSIDITNEQLENYSVNYGDILFQRSSENIEDAGKANIYLDKEHTATFGGFVIRGKRKADYNPIVVNEILKMGYVRKQAMKSAAGAQHINIGQDSLKKIWLLLPDGDTQECIEKISKLYSEQLLGIEKLIKEKLIYRNWLIKNLLTGKKRVSGFHDKWKKIKIGSFIREINERSTINNEHNVLSVTKTGICLQSEHFNKQIASEDNIGYKVVRRGNLVFSTMNLWMGSLDVLKEYDVGIVSPAYKVFEFNPKYMLTQFGNYFMKTEHMIWIYNINSEQGASVVRKNLDLEGLLNYIVAIPDIQEQRAIAKLLKTADREIELLEKKLELNKQEKKAMMQLLLTGIVRVNKS